MLIDIKAIGGPNFVSRIPLKTQYHKIQSISSITLFTEWQNIDFSLNGGHLKSVGVTIIYSKKGPKWENCP